MVTIYDIAARCGVSASTVSYVLSGQGEKRRISPDTQSRVRTAAAELGYVGPQTASRLPFRSGPRDAGHRGLLAPAGF